MSLKRWILTFGLLFVLGGLLWYGYRNNPSLSLEMCLRDPLRYDREEIGVGTEAKVVEILPDGFLLKEMGRTIRVKGDPQNASPGDFVRLRAVFHRQGYLELKHLYIAKGRRFKIYISIVAALLILFLVLRTYRFDWRRMFFTERV